MLQQQELRKQAYNDAFKDAQLAVHTELTDAQRAVEKSTAAQRELRARLKHRDEAYAALQRECDAAKGARHHCAPPRLSNPRHARICRSHILGAAAAQGSRRAVKRRV